MCNSITWRLCSVSPRNEYTTDNLNLSHAEKVLNKDHYGLEKVKERILEHLAVLKLRGD